MFRPGPISLDEVAKVFTDFAVAKAARRAGLPDRTDLTRLAADIRASVAQLVKRAHQPSSNAVHREIGALVRAADRQDYDALAVLVDSMSDQARGLLEARARTLRERKPRKGGEDRSWDVPDSAALRDPQRWASAAETILSLAVTGGYKVLGRKRPSGNRSRAALRWRLHAPEPSTSEPRRDAERQFLVLLRVDYGTATGREPAKTARRDKPGPFVRFFAECLRMARVPVSDADHDRLDLAVQLINDLAQEHRRADLVTEWQRIIDPLADVSQAVAEIGSLIEDGQAKVMRIARGEDKDGVADMPSLIEFQETGTLCFYLSPKSWRTIPLEAEQRAGIMQLAERLCGIPSLPRSPQRGFRRI